MPDMSPEELNHLRNSAGLTEQERFGQKKVENVGRNTVESLGYSYRGADHLVKKILTIPSSSDWSETKAGSVAEETTEGELLRAACEDLAILPRFRELSQITTYSVAPGVELFFNDCRVAIADAYELVLAEERSDVLIESLGEVRKAEAYHQSLIDERVRLNAVLAKSDTDPKNIPKTINRLNEVDLALQETGVDVSTRMSRVEYHVKTLTLAGENISTVHGCLNNKENTKSVQDRLKNKRGVVMRVEQGVIGINAAAAFLHTLVGMQTDTGGIIKVFTGGGETSIPTHMLRFLSKSNHLNQATTIAMREMLRLCYPPISGGVVTHDSLINIDSKKNGGLEIKKSLTAEKYTPAQRDRFIKIWEDVVVKSLEDKEIVGSLKLAEDAVSFSFFLMEAFTLGQTAYQRDRSTGMLVNPSDSGSSGTGSMYDRGGVDTVDKAHMLHDRKQAEADKGRLAPRPTIIKGLSQELLYSIFQYTEARNFKGEALNMSVLEALTSDRSDYTMAEFIDNLTVSGHFTYMLFAFRACQISDKLDQLVNGRISVIKELGGGPEKLVEDMIDNLQGLGKAFQTIPFGRGAIQPWMAGSEDATISAEAKKLKTVEINRNVVNMLADFYRGATAGTGGSGGYTDNPDWRGFKFADLLPARIYERLVTYTNLLTPQQCRFAIEMARDNGAFNMGGVLTEDMVYGGGETATKLRELLSQNAAESDESLINLVKAHGVDGTASTKGELDTAIKKVINGSAKLVEGSAMVDKTMVQRAKLKNPKLTRHKTRA